MLTWFLRSVALHASAALLIGLLSPWTADAEIVSAELRVDGMACPFCAFGIEKKLRAVSGVETVEVFLDEGRISLAFASTNRASIEALEEAVAKAGFELASLRLDFHGALKAAGSEHLVEDEAGYRFRLLESRNGAVRAVSEETLDRAIREQPDGGVFVGGTVARDGNPPGLILDGPVR